MRGLMRIDKSLTIPEVLKIVADAEDREDKVAYLKAYNTRALRFVIDGLYNIDWEGVPIPKFRPNHRPVGICNMTLNTALSRINAALQYKNSNPNVTLRNMSIVLEEISAAESALLTGIIKGRKIKGISKSVFREAYPEQFRFQNETEESETEN